MDKCAGSVRSGNISLRGAPRKYRQEVATATNNQEIALSGDADEELLTLSSVHRKRLYLSLIVSGRQVRFLVDGGATVNLLPVGLAREMDSQLTNFRREESTLRKFDNTALKTEGMLTTRVEHSVNRQARILDFYIATTQPADIRWHYRTSEPTVAMDLSAAGGQKTKRQHSNLRIDPKPLNSVCLRSTIYSCN